MLFGVLLELYENHMDPKAPVLLGDQIRCVTVAELLRSDIFIQEFKEKF